MYCGFPASALDDATRQSLVDTAGTVHFDEAAAWSNLSDLDPSPALAEAEVVFGQPPVTGLGPATRWVHLTSAGWSRYASARERLQAAGVALSTSSTVYAEPCAQHALAFVLAHLRSLPQAVDDAGTWPSLARRATLGLLDRQRVLLLGHGAIARRFIALLAPWPELQIQAFHRAATPPLGIGPDAVDEALAAADIVVNTLPGTDQTHHFLDARRLALLRPSCLLINVGRGTTVDTDALVAALHADALGAAYLDVTDPEPLPPEHPLWRSPRCFITPHTAGGTTDERARLVRHFLNNLARYRHQQPLLDRVI